MCRVLLLGMMLSLLQTSQAAYEYHHHFKASKVFVWDEHIEFLETPEDAYQILFFWRTRNVILYNQAYPKANQALQDPAINQVGIFKTQYALRMQHALMKDLTMGFTGILGKKGYLERQFALNLRIIV